MHVIQHVKLRIPGLLLCAAVTLLAYGVEWLEVYMTGARFMDALVFSILLGTAFHSIFGLKPSFHPGVHYSAKFLLEVAIVLLGASISLAVIETAGATLLVVVAVIVLLAICISYTIGRLLGLPERLSLLIACGNSICGNSAIVAAAPVIDADSDDVASSIAFTAALGIIVVLILPTAAKAFGVDAHQYGIFAGLTVYAVPQVLAATVPVSTVSVHIGTIVKLIRVLMLGPVILLLGYRMGHKTSNADGKKASIKLQHLLPWFIIGFFAMIVLNSMGVIPKALIGPIHQITTLLTILSMAALGLLVNVKTVFASGGRVLAAGALSILALGTMSAMALYFLHL